jgi:hypothetical protein|tara:strand:- start:12734 stop:12880 length:147 start_codon:yes stop_codon:yes gene_type:complete
LSRARDLRDHRVTRVKGFSNQTKRGLEPEQIGAARAGSGNDTDRVSLV